MANSNIPPLPTMAKPGPTNFAKSPAILRRLENNQTGFRNFKSSVTRSSPQQRVKRPRMYTR